MIKILCIGCSFTAGYYTVGVAPDDGGVKEIPHPELGWWSELNPLYHYDVYSFFGGGYLNYAHLVDTVNLGQYSAVILQESWENRLSIPEDTDWLPGARIKNTTVNHKTHGKLFVGGIRNKPFITDRQGSRYGTEFTDQHRQYLTDIGDSPYMQTVVRSSASLVNRRLRDVPVFSFNLHTPTDFSDITDFHRIPFDNNQFNRIFYTDGHNYDLDTDFTGHFNRYGTQVFASIVKQAFDKYDYPRDITLRF